MTDEADPAPDPLAVDCPHCLATAGYECHAIATITRPLRTVAPHASRRALAKALAPPLPGE